MKIVILMMFLILELSAVNQNDVLGKWQAITKTINNGTHTIEKEYLNLNADHTFSMLLLVSVYKGDAFIKNLRIEGSGIWKVWNNTFVVVVKKVEVPVAGEVYLISQESLRNLAKIFKKRFENEPIRISIIENINRNTLILINEKEKMTSYMRK